MSKYNYDLDYLTLGCDISREEILEIIEESDSIIKSHNFDTNTFCRAGIYFLKGEHDKVITDCNEAIRLKPDHA